MQEGKENMAPNEPRATRVSRDIHAGQNPPPAPPNPAAQTVGAFMSSLQPPRAEPIARNEHIPIAHNMERDIPISTVERYHNIAPTFPPHTTSMQTAVRDEAPQGQHIGTFPRDRTSGWVKTKHVFTKDRDGQVNGACHDCGVDLRDGIARTWYDIVNCVVPRG